MEFLNHILVIVYYNIYDQTPSAHQGFPQVSPMASPPLAAIIKFAQCHFKLLISNLTYELALKHEHIEAVRHSICQLE